MIRFLLQRLLLGVISLLVIYTVTFVMVISTPGNPFQSSERRMPPEVVKALRARYDIDDHFRYYFQYARGVVTRLDFGPSFQYKEWSVNQILVEALPVSITIGTLALAAAVLIGVPLGVMSAVRRGGLADHLAGAVVLVGASVPSFVTATFLLGIFAIRLKIVPVGGWGELRHLVLPSVCLAFPLAAAVTRLMRVGMLDCLGSDYIRTARAKGLPERRVICKHAFKNAFLPVLSYLGPAAAHALTGSFIVETVFNAPGLGIYFVQAVQNLDRGLIMAVVLVFSALVIFFNVIVDVLYAWVDPRIQIA